MAKDKSKTKGETKSKATGSAGDDDEFASGAPTSNFKIADHEGDLVLITPLSLEEDIETAFGASDAIKANVVVLDLKSPEDSEENAGALIFQRVLRSQLEPFIGKRKVLGRIGRGVAKKGQDAPFIIEDPSDADKAVARVYLKSVDPLG